MTDHQSSLIIQGLQCVQSLRNFQLIQNEFKLESLNQLKTILNNNTPYHLRELTLIDCGIKSAVSEQLLQTLVKKMSVQTLVLQKVQYNKQGVLYLAKLIEESKSLSVLDISWSQLPQGMMRNVLEALSHNRKLAHFNISWNNISDSEILPLESTKSAKSSKLTWKNLPKAQVFSFSGDCISKFIKYNKNL